jgi:hypothetical protein
VNILPTFGGFSPKSTLVAFALNLKVKITIKTKLNRETKRIDKDGPKSGLSLDKEFRVL